MRKISLPPVCRAKSQLNIAVRILPTWGKPVGLGAKRTLTGVVIFLFPFYHPTQ